MPARLCDLMEFVKYVREAEPPGRLAHQFISPHEKEDLFGSIEQGLPGSNFCSAMLLKYAPPEISMPDIGSTDTGSDVLQYVWLTNANKRAHDLHSVNHWGDCIKLQKRKRSEEEV